MSKLRNGTPQWAAECRPALHRARARLASAEIDGVRWYWPIDENPAARNWTADADAHNRVRLLAPFDPIVWDRRRFELFWNWSYRFEAYTPPAKRLRGYYALPLLWREDVIGWANLSVMGNELNAALGFSSGSAPRGKDFKRALDAELRSVRDFLHLI